MSPDYLHRILYSFAMGKKRTQSTVIPITEAATRGVSDLARQAENGIDIVLTRHGKPVAVVMSIHRAERIDRLEEELVDAAFVLSRVSNDDGARFSADDVLAEFGIGRPAKRSS
jgi:prevent-host-death family protein